MRSFGSDNHSGAHPKILAALAEANTDHCVAYGSDRWTQSATSKLREIFGSDTGVYFVYNGTGANVLATLAALARHEAVICSSFSHINTDECGAPEAATACKLIPVSSYNAKLSVERIEPLLQHRGSEHCMQPKMISITQSNEYGLLYTADEVRALAEFAHEQGMLLHMDGARFSNAAAALGIGLREASRDLGVDILSFGGTKNGLMFGEAVLFFASDRFPAVKFERKRIAQLNSKMRFISAQFLAYLDQDLWRSNAMHANCMAVNLSRELDSVAGIRVTRSVQTNMVYAEIDPSLREYLQQEFMFYLMDATTNESRLVASWDTKETDIEKFISRAKSFPGLTSLSRSGSAAALVPDIKAKLKSFMANCSQVEFFEAMREPWLNLILPGLENLHGCDQGTQAHLEGDVATHVALVLANFRRLVRNRYGREPSFIELLTILMHDVCKPQCRVVGEAGAVSFPHHEAMAAELVPAVARRLELSDSEVSELLFLVAHHGEAHGFPKLSANRQSELRASPYFQSLALFQEADALSCVLPGNTHLAVHWDAMMRS